MTLSSSTHMMCVKPPLSYSGGGSGTRHRGEQAWGTGPSSHRQALTHACPPVWASSCTYGLSAQAGDLEGMGHEAERQACVVHVDGVCSAGTEP